MHDDGIVSIASGGKQTGIKAAYSLKNSSSYVVVNVVKSVNINGKYEKYEAKFKVSISTGEGNVGAENNAPLPKDVSYYTEHPQVPDFGAMLGIEPMSVERSGGVVGYSYDAASKDSSGKVVKDYVALLERCGYTYAGGGYMDDGNSIVYYDNKKRNKN